MEILARGVKFMTRVYVIHADQDYLFFDRLAAQARSAKLPVEFDHMVVKQTWVENWKGSCRNRIYRCGGAIVFLSKHTAQGGVGWELECAQNCALPMLGLCVEGSSANGRWWIGIGRRSNDSSKRWPRDSLPTLRAQ